MSTSWRTVRVFISSTFRDMHAERDHLVRVVFPRSRERLTPHRVHLVDVDLRWGVTREQAENDRALDLCLSQIDECRPYFLGLLGERYGWVPSRYPADAVARFGWIERHAGKSVTELEIAHGALLHPLLRGRALFCFRDPAAIGDIRDPSQRSIYAETDDTAAQKLAQLKDAIRRSGHPVVDPYPARWDPQVLDRSTGSQGRFVGLDEFGARVFEYLWEAFCAELNLDPSAAPAAADPTTEEGDFHERFMESRLRVYVGRESFNRQLLGFAEAPGQLPAVVTGPSGSGKSAALSHFVADHRRRFPNALVIPHFVGASPRSTNLRDVLQRCCQAIQTRFNIPGEIPDEVARLIPHWRELLGRVPSGQRVLIVIDALNQLDPGDRAFDFRWLPTSLPAHVKLVASYAGAGGGPSPLAVPRGRFTFLELPPLSDDERRAIIRDVPSLSAKALDEAQVALLLDNPATRNPLFLLVALEELRGFGSYRRVLSKPPTRRRRTSPVRSLPSRTLRTAVVS